ncbi:response regulator [Halovenus sp. WSH3]|uniref:Response regulator n=1 Tax=Halovenus carboxidivorans TaxID=2692199 RepID=A0A6B0T3S8_9EURY|nr:response regulator [Halovenus carboxidivorans]MXR52734.1 response regulator [Halovenus carboxidivorans]
MTGEESASVLIVDDERPLLESYAAMLERSYEVQTAATGAEALEAVDEQTDVVLLDRRMQEYEGEELLARIRDRGLDCQVVFCSAVVPDVEILSVEPDGYLHKPVGTDELIETVERQLEQADEPESVREYLRLEGLKSTLEEAQPLSRLQSTAAYQDLLDRVERKKQCLDNSHHSAPAA